MNLLIEHSLDIVLRAAFNTQLKGNPDMRRDLLKVNEPEFIFYASVCAERGDGRRQEGICVRGWWAGAALFTSVMCGQAWPPEHKGPDLRSVHITAKRLTKAQVARFLLFA